MFDPTAGTGTTFVAALLLSRKVAGCDCDKKMGPIVAQRVSNVVQQLIKTSFILFMLFVNRLGIKYQT